MPVFCSIRPSHHLYTAELNKHRELTKQNKKPTSRKKASAQRKQPPRRAFMKLNPKTEEIKQAKPKRYPTSNQATRGPETHK